MKVARFRAADGEHWGAVDVDAGTVRSITGAFEKWAPVITADGSEAVELEGAVMTLDEVQLLPPLIPTSEITGIGYNYASFMVPAEGADPPVYTKPLSSIVGPDDTIEFPDLIAIQPQCRFCHEIQLAVVVGSARIADARHGTRDVLGYTIANDGALRGTRPSFVGMDLFGERSSYHSSALGPWIVTTDELGGDGQPDLTMTTTVNGVVTQEGRTTDMRWGVDQVIEEMSNRTLLRTGDMVFTGTCGYIGVTDGHYLAGDVVELAIEGIGTLRNVVSERRPLSDAPEPTMGWGHVAPGRAPGGRREGRVVKLARYHDADGDRSGQWGVVDADAGTIRRIAAAFDHWAPAVTEDPSTPPKLDGAPLPLTGVRLLAPLTPTCEIMGTGVNYPNWVIPYEGMDSPFYYKSLSSMIGPGDEIKFAYLAESQPLCRTCYEIELVVVMGRPVGDRKQAMRDVLGYAVGNDSCVRGMQPSFLGMDLLGSKCAYHASSVGPWITTRDELGGDGQPDLEITIRVNGTVTQHDRTSAMNWPIEKLVYECDYRSHMSTGDLLYTGTCGFIGVPDGFYEPGDVIEAEIEGIGVLRNTVEPADPYTITTSEEERDVRERVAGGMSHRGVH